MERTQANDSSTPMREASAALREALASRDLPRLAEALSSRARVLAEFAASASPAELAEAQADNETLSEFLVTEKTTLFADVRRSQTLQRALSHNLPIGDPRRRGTLA